MTEPRSCTECNRLLKKRVGETLEQYSKRIYCSRLCIEAWQRRNLKKDS